MQNVQDTHSLRTQIFRLNRNKQIAPLVETVRDAKRRQPSQASCKIKPGTLAGLQNDGKTQNKKDQSINKIDHGSVDQEELSKRDHVDEIVAYGPESKYHKNLRLLPLLFEVLYSVFFLREVFITSNGLPATVNCVRVKRREIVSDSLQKYSDCHSV